MVTFTTYFPYATGAGSNVTEDQWRQIIGLLFPTSVVAASTSGLNALAVSQRAAGANMSVDVATGWSFVKGELGIMSAAQNLAIAANASGNPRIDRIVVRNDFLNKRMDLDVLTGTPAGSPVAPALTQNTTTMWEISLAQIAVASGAVSIVTANITDERRVMRALDTVLYINTQTDSYTLTSDDAGAIVELNKATAVNLTVPPNASVAFPVGTQITLSQIGAGQVTVVAGSGVTIRTPDTLKLAEQYAMAALYKRGTNEWVLAGYLALV